MEDHIPMEFPSRKPIGLRGRKLVFPSAIVADKVKPKWPFTIEASKKNDLVKDDITETSSHQKGKSKCSEKPIEFLMLLLLNMKAIPPLRGSKGSLRKQDMKLIN
jgi:hypothetical protein